MCGIVGMVNQYREVASYLYIGLFAQQHRGKESACIVTWDGENFHDKGDMGEIPAIFRGDALKKLPGQIGIAHNRYSTASSSDPENIQPIREFWKGKQFWVAHNGNLINAEEIRQECFNRGKIPVTSSDTGAMATLISLSQASSFEEAVKETVPKLKGSFSIVILTDDELIAVRDELGIRPLCLGKRENDWILASETCVFSHLGAVPVREIDPGEILIIKKSGIQEYYHPPVKKRKFCIFELIYFSRPDSIFFGRRLMKIRENTGRFLGKTKPVPVSPEIIAIPIPDSGMYGGLGFIKELGLENGGAYVLLRPHIFSRTFIEPVQTLRELGASLKYVIFEENVRGKIIVLIDDSTVRGTTTKKLVKRMRDAGAVEVHARICSPPYRYPCYYGIDTYRVRNELLAARHNGNLEEMRQELDLNSLGYLDIGPLIQAIIQTPGEPLKDCDFCTACFTGESPL